MERVRMPHVRQVAVPAPLPVPLEMSKEERHRLRVARHQAFQRHQQNAAWTRELLVGHSPPLAAGASSATPRAFAARLAGLSSDAVRKVLEDKQRALATVQSELERAEQQLERAEGADEEMAALKQLGDLQAVVDARERLIAQRATLLAPSDRKMEIVRL